MIKLLPLWVSHYDLNDVNVMIDDECKVSGHIDWELSAPLSFGARSGCIHTLAGEYTGGEFWMPNEFETAERGFWSELWVGMPKDAQELIEGHFDLVQEAVIPATFFDCFFFEDGRVGVGEITLKALPKLISYRVPFVRGQEPPCTQ
jgi:hypothetical protein